MFTDWQRIIDNCGLFWQYPVITEKEFYNQNKSFSNYVAFPWATVLDKNVKLEEVVKYLSQFLNNNIDYYTCCQHIRFRELTSVFEALGIKKVYTPHKCVGEDTMGSVELLPCPLYAVNYEDDSKNSQFVDCDFLNKDRKYLYSFMGGLQPGYLTKTRNNIFDSLKNENTYIENTGGWHFNEIVYTNKQNKQAIYEESSKHKNNTEKYNSVLLDSVFSLCPSGTGPNSIRFWESLACGSIPVLLSDTLELPKHDLWEKAIIKIDEKDCNKIYDTLSNITKDELEDRRRNCLKIYEHFRNNYANENKKTIVHYCCGAYYRGNFGGVACYDYQLSKVFPQRVFFEGPRERDEMLKFLETCENPLVITDNHLSCDIPNKYNTFVVHHGVALTHAIREPTWDPYWKELCCNGQDKMFYHRFPESTKFISISKFCSDEFLKHYRDDYERFDRLEILHSSEMNSNIYKQKWNDTPVVLGNWSTENKGKLLINQLKNNEDGFVFKNLSVFPIQGDIEDFIRRKQGEYINSDIFLQLSLSEGNSYATLDALLCGLPVVASNVGLFYKDIPEDCFVKIEWEKNNDLEYVNNKLKYAWENKEKLSNNARQWYMSNCSNEIWQKKMRGLIKHDFK